MIEERRRNIQVEKQRVKEKMKSRSETDPLDM
jgi:hypothetical protein